MPTLRLALDPAAHQDTASAEVVGPSLTFTAHRKARNRP
jgi:hypothetical protein